MALPTRLESNGGRVGPITPLTDLSFSVKRSIAVAIYCTVAAIGCDGAMDRPVLAESNVSLEPVLIVDSVLPVAVALERFQRGLPRVSRLEGAARSRDDLVTRFMAALESADSAELATLHVSKAEYGFLYFPTSVYTRKPYELAPDIAWLLSEQNSRKGRDRIIRRLAGNRLGLRGYTCEPPAREGRNQFWRSCRVEYTDPAAGQRVTKRLFGPIIERDGSYKLLSFANDF